MENNKGKNIVIGILIGIIVCLIIIIIFICYNKFIVKNENSTYENNNSTINNNTSVENSIDYSSKYEKDGSEITITKSNNGYDVEIGIFRLGTFTGKTTNISDGKLTIIASTNSDANNIEFVFDYNTKILTVQKSNWELLSEGKTYNFNNV